MLRLAVHYGLSFGAAVVKAAAAAAAQAASNAATNGSWALIVHKADHFCVVSSSVCL